MLHEIVHKLHPAVLKSSASQTSSRRNDFFLKASSNTCSHCILQCWLYCWLSFEKSCFTWLAVANPSTPPDNIQNYFFSYSKTRQLSLLRDTAYKAWLTFQSTTLPLTNQNSIKLKFLLELYLFPQDPRMLDLENITTFLSQTESFRIPRIVYQLLHSTLMCYLWPAVHNVVSFSKSRGKTESYKHNW